MVQTRKEPAAIDDAIVETRSGRLRSRMEDGVATDLGNPYAVPPTGELRLTPPHLVAPWVGVCDAVEPGPTAPQRGVTPVRGNRRCGYHRRGVAARRRLPGRERLGSRFGGAPPRAGLHPRWRADARYDGGRSVNPQSTLAALGRASRPGAVDLPVGACLRANRRPPGDRRHVLPRHPLAALADGAGRNVDLLVTATGKPLNFITATLCLLVAPMWLAKPLLRRLVQNADQLLPTYPRADCRTRGGAILSCILGDIAFRVSARQYAAAHTGRTFFVELDWDSSASGGRLGACNGSDLAVVFFTLPSVIGPHGIPHHAPPQALADRVHGIWTRLIATVEAPRPQHGGVGKIVHRLAAGVSESEAPLLAETASERVIVGAR